VHKISNNDEWVTAVPTRTLLFAFILTICTATAAAEDVGTQPGGQVPRPNAAPAQPVAGAMPNSAAVPSTISEKNARDDKLSIALKNLNDDQRQAIYRSVMANVQKSQPTAPSISTPVDVGTALPPTQSAPRRGSKPDSRGEDPAIRIQR
jgi:hypothetical protein